MFIELMMMDDRFLHKFYATAWLYGHKCDGYYDFSQSAWLIMFYWRHMKSQNLVNFGSSNNLFPVRR